MGQKIYEFPKTEGYTHEKSFSFGYRQLWVCGPLAFCSCRTLTFVGYAPFLVYLCLQSALTNETNHHQPFFRLQIDATAESDNRHHKPSVHVPRIQQDNRTGRQVKGCKNLVRIAAPARRHIPRWTG